MDDNQQTNAEPAQIAPEVQLFLQNILDDAGMNDLDQQLRENMIQELYKRLDDYMLATIVNSLPDNKLEEFTKKAEAGASREELEKYLHEHVPDVQKVFSSAMSRMSEEKNLLSLP